MRRNLRFWTRYTWESVEVELICVGVFLVLSTLSSEPAWTGSSGGWADFLALAPFYLIVAAVLSIVMIVPGCQILYIPLLVSHGEPRKNVYWGYQYYRFLLIAVTSAVSGLVWALVPSEISTACLSCLPMIVTGLVIASSFGNLLGSAYVRWKWLGVVVLVLFFGACGGMAGWIGSHGGFDIAEVSVFTLGLTTMVLPWQLIAAAVVLLVIDLSVQWLLLRRREVKL